MFSDYSKTVNAEACEEEPLGIYGTPNGDDAPPQQYEDVVLVADPSSQTSNSATAGGDAGAENSMYEDVVLQAPVDENPAPAAPTSDDAGPVAKEPASDRLGPVFMTEEEADAPVPERIESFESSISPDDLGQWHGGGEGFEIYSSAKVIPSLEGRGWGWGCWSVL